MKKRRFMGLFALASCVTLLTGCDSNAFFGLGGYVNEILEKLGIQEKEEKKDEPTPEPEPEPTPEPKPEPVKPVGEMIISELPATLFPGDVLDLDDYVTLKKISSYSVVVTEGSDLVTQDGHKLTIIGEGDLAFTVSAGSHSQSFSYDTMHQIRKDFVAAFEGVGNRYTLDIYQPEYDDDDNYIGMAWDDTLYHSSNYILSFTSFGSDDDGNLIPGGLLRFSEESDSSYMFELLEDEEQGEYVKLMDQYSPRLLEYYNSDFSVDFSSAKYEYDAKNDVEMFVVEGDAAVTFAENSLFIPNGALSLQDGTDIPFSRIEFYFQDISEEGEEPELVPCCDSYVLYNGKNEYWSTALILLDEENIGYPLLEAYCQPENEPEPFDYYNEFFQGHKLSDLLVSNESAFGATGYYEAQYGWFNDSGVAISQPSQATSFFGGQLPLGSLKRVTSETSFWNVESSDQGYYPTSGKTTVNKGSEEEPNNVVYSVFSTEEGYYTEADYDCVTVWDDSKPTFGGLRDPENWVLGAITGVEQTTFQEQAAYSFSFRSGKYHGLLYAICDGIEGMSLIEETIEWYYSASGGDNLEEFFDMEMLICPSYGYVQFTVNFTWESGQNYMIMLSSVYSPSYAQLTSAFEAAINPLCE